MVGQRIRYYRKVKGLTQEELAQGICSVSYLSKIEKGDAKSSDEVINLLCDRLGISPNEANNDEILEMLDEWNMMMVNKRFDEAGEFQKTVQEKMQGVSDPKILMMYELFTCRYLITIDQLNDAFVILEKVKEHITSIDNNELLFYFNQFLGMYHSYNFEYKDALTSFKQAEQFYSKSKIREIEAAIIYYQLAVTYSHLSRVSTVNYYAYKAISIFDKEYNYSRSADSQILLAIGNRRVRNFEQATYHLNQALKYAKTFKDNDTTAIIYHNLGFIAASKKEHIKATEYILKGLEYKNSYLNNVAISLFLLSKEYYILNNLKEAKRWLQRGLKELETSNPPNIAFQYHFGILKHQIEGDITTLEEYLRKEAIPYFESQNLLEDTANYSELLADLYFDQSLYKKASLYYRLSNNARKNIF